MRKIAINCQFGDQTAPFDFYVGQPEEKHEALSFQEKWLLDNRGGVVPPEVKEALVQLRDLAKKNNVSFEDLCVYALGSAQNGDDKE